MERRPHAQARTRLERLENIEWALYKSAQSGHFSRLDAVEMLRRHILDSKTGPEPDTQGGRVKSALNRKGSIY